MPLYDVVIVGAGLAGLQCARLLGAAGLRVVLLDRKPSLGAEVHTTGIFVRRTLEDFDLPADCLGPAVRHVSLYAPSLMRLDLESSHTEFRVGRMAGLYERFLADAVGSGVVWMPATRCVCLEVGSPTRLRIERGGRREILPTRFVIAADGAQSRAARSLGLDTNSEFIVGVEDVLRGVPLSGPPRFHCFLDPRIAPGYIAWLVNDGEEAHLGVGGYATRFDPLRALEDFRNRLAGIADFRRAQPMERRGGLIPVGGVLRRLANRCGLLVGDAAGAVSPLTAGGLDPAMRLSSLAAQLTAQYLSTADPSVLAAYSGGQFRARFISRLWMRRLLAAVRSPLLVETGCALLRLPGPRHLAWHVFFGRGSFPDVPIASPRPLALQTAPRKAMAPSR
jgi:flavin-dependent dehydrogenase